MTCMYAFAETMAMATTQLTRAESSNQPKTRMSWVVVTDKDGERQLRVLWRRMPLCVNHS
ncbi:MAG: hypothetical protein ABSG02_04250 [Terriglobales bacterium]|jgi:hypothetical protein